MLQAEQPTVQANGGAPGCLKQEAALKSLREVREVQESCADQDCALNACCAQADVPDGEAMREESQTCEQELLKNVEGWGDRRRQKKKTAEQDQETEPRPRTKRGATENSTTNSSKHLSKDNGKSVQAVAVDNGATSKKIGRGGNLAIKQITPPAQSPCTLCQVRGPVSEETLATGKHPAKAGKPGR